MLVCLSVLLFKKETLCQDKNLVAKSLYLKAEDAFNNEQYLYSYYLLGNAARTLGGNNSKILDLKIRAAYNSVKTDNDYKLFHDLKGDLNAFFKITDSKNYPEDKYLAIVEIKEKISKMMVEVPLVKNIIDQHHKRCMNNDVVFFNNIQSVEFENIEESTEVDESVPNSTGKTRVDENKYYILKGRSYRYETFAKDDNRKYSFKYFYKNAVMYRRAGDDDSAEALQDWKADVYKDKLQKNPVDCINGFLRVEYPFDSTKLHLRFKCFSGYNDVELVKDADFSLDKDFQYVYIFDKTTFDFIGARINIWENDRIHPYTITTCGNFKLVENKIWVPFDIEFIEYYKNTKTTRKTSFKSVQLNKEYDDKFWY